MDNKFESALVYDMSYHQNNESDQNETQAVLVIDLDNCQAQFGSYSKTGKTQLFEQPVNPPSIEAMSGRIPDTTNSLLDDMEIQKDEVNQAFRIYLRSGKKKNLNCLQHNDENMNCGKVEEVLQSEIQATKELIQLIKAEAEQLKIDLMSIHIVLIGRLANFYLFEHLIKDNLSFYPFQNDPRFVNNKFKLPPEKIVAKGQQILQELNTIGVNLGLELYLDDLPGVQEVILADKNMSKNALSEPVFIKNIYAVPGEEISFKIGNSLQKIRIPDHLFNSTSGTFDIGLQFDDNALQCLIRNSGNPEKSESVRILK